MKIIGFRGFDWRGVGFGCHIPKDAKPFLTVAPNVLYRVGNSPTFGPSQIGERAIPAEFSYRGGPYSSYEDAWSALLARLNVYDARPGRLRCERLDGTIVEMDAVLTMPNAAGFSGIADIMTLPVVFITVDPFWIATSPTSLTKTNAALPLDMAMPLPIETSLAKPPTITFQPTVQRVSQTAAAGWKWRQVIRVVNSTGRALVNHPYLLSLGNTSTLVAATKMQADGDDVRIINNGKEVPRDLKNMNTAATDALINIANLAVGATMDFEVWYGNPSAASPATLAASPQKSALVLSSSTNVLWKYAVDESDGAGAGGWALSTASGVPSINNDAPGAWRFVTTRPSVDDTWQNKYSLISGSAYRGIFDAQRARQASISSLPEYTDADGVMLYHPAGISNVRVGLQWLNDYARRASGNPVGRVVLLRSADGTAWTTVNEWASVQLTLATIAAANYAISPASPYVAFAVWPYAGDRVPSASTTGRRVYARWDAELGITVGATITQSVVQAEEAIYELALEYRTGGDTALVAPYRALRIGGDPTRRFAVRVNENLVINLADRKAEVWNSALTAKVANAPVAAIVAREKLTDAASEAPSARWLDIQPYVNQLVNPSAAVNVSSWSAIIPHANATFSGPNLLSRHTPTFKTAPASFLFSLTASTVPTATIAGYVFSNDKVSTTGKPRAVVAADFRTSTASLKPLLNIWFYDKNDAFVSSSTAADWTPTAHTWYRRVHTAPVPASAAYYRVGVMILTGVANVTGSVLFDDISPDANDLIITDVAPGTTITTVGYLSQYA